jgi:AraC-like DNA-binding protein
MNTSIKEITPLTQNDCFAIFSRTRKSFNLPLHFHEEFELTLIINAPGAKRIVGDHEGIIGDIELVLVGPNLSHVWLNHECQSELITELTVQWHKDLFEEKFLKKNLLGSVRTMLEQASRGLLFSSAVAQEIAEKLFTLNQNMREIQPADQQEKIGGNKNVRGTGQVRSEPNETSSPHKIHGFNAIVELMSILHLLSTAEDTCILSKEELNNNQILHHNSRRIDKVLEYMNLNFQQNITLKDLAKIVSMTEVSFSRFIKKRTGNTFVDTLNEIRIGHASRMLIAQNESIAEIAVQCGFNNISNFNRVFKSKKHCTPKEFRENFSGTRVFI